VPQGVDKLRIIQYVSNISFEAVNHLILAKCIKVRWLLHMSVVLTMFRDETISKLVKHITHTSIECLLERNNYCKWICGATSAQAPRYAVTERSSIERNLFGQAARCIIIC
jgi:hypothetical protein